MTSGRSICPLLGCTGMLLLKCSKGTQNSAPSNVMPPPFRAMEQSTPQQAPFFSFPSSFYRTK
ncbi:hypothetical protein I7I50_08347 [Histoplasma capsulatum G186AR]|uniref:Uncharacterized protein n=1 Tax=Ajellomyces capsulatus TaxID=5037 RepID=A0A8H8CZM5_AJECA|nr:hypothetical protein I7I52_05863 [Histoplasma capsulatum]QSS73543.1 hypothetical protein I7I50_08347 [Histoplasma capsulatum G186AR]